MTGNRIHNDRGPALDLDGCDGVAASRNRFSNYRPDEDDGAGGEAVRVGACRNVTFENNSVLEASVAVRIGGPEGGTKAPEAIAFSRNYLQNKLTGDSTAFAIDAGRTIRLTNNVIDHYAEAFRIAPGVRGLTVANNLVLSPKTAFSLGSRESVALFDRQRVRRRGEPERRGGGGAGRRRLDDRADAAVSFRGRREHRRRGPREGPGLSNGGLRKGRGRDSISRVRARCGDREH